MKYALGIDIGGTNTVVGLVDKEGNVLGTDSVKTQSLPVLEEYVKTVSKMAKVLATRFMQKKRLKIAKTCLSSTFKAESTCRTAGQSMK